MNATHETLPGFSATARASRLVSITAAFFLALLPTNLQADTSAPDFTGGGEIPEGATHDWNLGPTGARGWMHSNKMETSEARQIRITRVEKGSPADGILQPGDVILGTAGIPFSFDPRTELGKAVGKAEAGDGSLSLIRWRKGKTAEAVLGLAVLGAYAPSAPFDCPKSKLIFKRGCELLARRMKENPEAGNRIVRCYNALALLSSGKPEYLPQVREQLQWASQYTDPERRSYHSWFYGPVNILLAEYTLATGDRTFFPDLKRVTMEIVRGRSPVGSWGHRFVQSNGRLAGYGMMNAPGLPLTLSLILARMAGIEDPELDRAIDRSTRLVRFYAGKGSVPYGDHHPWIQTHEDNGKNGIAAVMFNLLDDAPAASFFSRMSVASHGAERDTGHTGNFFNMLWAMPGVALSGPNATGAWMEEFGWYYDLARRWDGGFIHQGPPGAKPDSYHGWDCTGAFLLAYGRPLGKIHLTGRKRSVVEQVGPETAESLIEDGRGWSPRRKHAAYADRSVEELFKGLGSWSPVVRERSAMELAGRKGDPIDRLVKMLEKGDLHSRLGACRALTRLGKRAAGAVPPLRKTLKANDLWLRIKAAEALAAVGTPAMEAVPDLLEMLAEKPPPSDPRGMEQRYLCFALFQSRGGLLHGTIEGVDRQALLRAVRAGLANEDGRARGALGSVYGKLTWQEIRPLLPAIHEAIVEPSPSGIMFADGIRLKGLEILAKHRIREGMALCLDVMGIDRWGKKNRIARCLKALQAYGGAARPLLPRLEKLEKNLSTHREAKGLQKEIDLIRTVMETIRTDENPPSLRSLAD